MAQLPEGAPKMLRLLSELANPSNNELLRRFYEEPQRVMGEFELTEGEQAIVLSGDLEVIQAALDSAAIAADYRVGSATGVVVTYSPPPRPTTHSVVATF